MLGQPSFWTKNYFAFKMTDKMFWPLTNIFPHWNIPCLQNKSQIVQLLVNRYVGHSILFNVTLRLYEFLQFQERTRLGFESAFSLSKVFWSTLFCFVSSEQHLQGSWLQTQSMDQDHIPSSEGRCHSCISGSLKHRGHIYRRWPIFINNCWCVRG